jgi:hypothetical protein
LIPKHQTRWTGFDDKIISLHSRGSGAEFFAHLIFNVKSKPVAKPVSETEQPYNTEGERRG